MTLRTLEQLNKEVSRLDCAIGACVSLLCITLTYWLGVVAI